MKKLLSIVLSIVMVLGMVMPMGVMAEETAELTQAERFELLNNPYTSFDMDFFEDFFATDEDLANENWDNSSTAENSNILAYKGFAYSNYSNRYPMDAKYEGKSTANVTAFRTSQIESTEGITKEADGSYTYTIDSTPFELGEIAETGKQGANGFLIRAVYNSNLYADEANPINAVPANYLTTEGKAHSVSPTIAVGQGIYTINKSGLESADLLMAAMYDTLPTYHTVYVTYEGEKTPVKYFAVSGYGTADLKEKIYLVPQKTYEDIKNGEGDAIMKQPTDYTLDEFKTIVGDDKLTKLPTYWKGSQDFDGDGQKESYDYSEQYNEYLEKTKYQKLKSSKDIVTLKSKENVDLKKLSANCEEANVLIPTAVQKFVPSQRVYYTTKANKKDYTTYVYKISVPLDPNKTVESIKIAGELRAPVDFVEESGGFAKVANNSVVHSAVLMLDYDGQDMVEFDGQNYYVFCDVQRECGTGSILGMTLVDDKTVYDEYVELNAQLQAIDAATVTNPECVSYRNQVAQLIAKSENVLLESDFDLSKIEEAEERFFADEIEANAAKIIKEGKKTNFPISEATGANSKFFMLYDTSADSDYSNMTSLNNFIIGLDYSSAIQYTTTDNYVYPTGVFETDSIYLKNGVETAVKRYAFVYSIDEEPSSKVTAEFTTKNGQTVWTVNGVDCIVNPEEKVFQLFSSNKTTNIADPAIAEKFTKTMNGLTFDVVDGYYEKVGFLAGSGWARTMSATLNYADGTSSVKHSCPFGVGTSLNSSKIDKKAGIVGVQDMTNISSQNVRQFNICEVEADPTKELVSIKLTASTYHGENPVMLVSAWGSNKTIEEKLVELGAIEVIDKASAAAAKEALADFDAYLAELGYTLKELGSFKASYTNLANAVADFEANAEKNEAIKNKYTQLEMVGPWDVFTVGDDISNAKWKVTSTASEPNLLAYKGFADSSSGNVQPSKGNIYAFRADMIEGSGISQHEDGRYYVNVGSVPFRLGEIKTVAGERGANAWVPRGKLDVSAFTEGGIPDIATTGDVTYTYGTDSYKTNIMTGTFNINKTNISAINFLTTGVGYHKDSSIPNNRLYDVYVKYEGEEEQHGFMFAGKLSLGIDESVYAIPYSEYESIMSDDSLAASTKEFEAYSVDEINALRGYTPEGIDFDTSKPITSKNYTLEQINAALGTSYAKFPTNWTKNSDTDTIVKDVHTSIVAKTKHTAISGKAKTLKALKATLDTTKLASAYEGATVAIPTEATNFVKYRRGGWNAEYDTIVNNTKYPLDPNKKVESVRIEGNMTDISGDKGVALGSGGVYYLEEWDTGRGIMMLTYNGDRKVNINGTEYVLFMKVQRECGDGMFLGATYERKSTIFEEVEEVNARINAIDENTKVAEIIAIRNNIESLKAESSYITDADFDMDKLTSAEATLSARKVAEATNAMSAITLESTIQEANAARDLYDYALLDANVTEASFDATLVALFNQIHAQIADKTNLKGSINVKYFQGETPSAEVTIENATKFAGKPYKVILAYYDAEENLIGTYIENKTSVKDEKVTFTVKADKDFANATSVKGFIWKDFATLLPLSDANATEKKTAFKVLSIGNSFSNNAHTYLGEIAQNAGFEKVIVSNLFIGGCTLEKHYTNLSGNLPAYTFYRKELVDGKIKSTTKEDSTMLEGILAEEWDVITIQQGSSHSAKAEKFTYLQDIIDYVNANKRNKDAKVVWHMTWSYKDDSDNLHSVYPGMTQMDMYNGIINAVKTQVLPLEDIDYVIPAGTAVQNARVPLGDTMNSDNIHLNNVANYMVGLLWFEKITGISLDTITYVPDNDTIKDNLAALKKAAKDALANPYEVTK